MTVRTGFRVTKDIYDIVMRFMQSIDPKHRDLLTLITSFNAYIIMYIMYIYIYCPYGHSSCGQ